MYPKNYPDNIVVGIIAGGDVNDPAPDQSSNMKVYFPTMHGKDVKVEHLAFSPLLVPPTKSLQQDFQGSLDPGSIVYAMKETGSNQCHILGTGNDILNYDQRIPGNLDLLSFPVVQQMLKRTIDIRIPPQVKEQVEKGARIRKKQEKGKLHAHELLKGLPSHGALYPLSGLPLPQITNVSTAIQSFSDILTADMAARLPGTSMSLGNMFSMFTNTMLKQINNSIPRELQGALSSMSTLIQSIEVSDGGTFATGSKVNPDVFMANAVSLLSQATNLHDLVSVMGRLQHDESLFGMDQIEPIEIEVDTPFGKVKQRIDAKGNITNVIPDAIKKAVEAFASSMSNASSFPGVNPGENLFGNSAQTMFNMFNRMAPAAQQVAIQLSSQLNTSTIAQSLDRLVKQTTGGGNPFGQISTS